MKRENTSPSHFQFQMWDQHLTRLNQLWDLEPTETQAPDDQDRIEAQESHFHSTLWNQHLLELNRSWSIASPPPIETQVSLVGKLLAPVKRLLLKWIQPSIDSLIQQQNAVNAQLVQTCNGLVDAVNQQAILRLEAQKEFNSRAVQSLNALVELSDAEMTRLREEWKQHARQLNGHIDELQTMVWTFDRRKEALEIDEIRLNRKVEQILALLREDQQTASEPSQELPAPGRQEDYTYLLFEHLYRGDEQTIKARQQAYLQFFQGRFPVLDIGCGRGEFLELLRDEHIESSGLDVNQAMIDYCRKKDLPVEEIDAETHLRSLPENSLGGIFSAQVVEHYAPTQLHRLLSLCFDKLQPQSYLVIETQNPQSLYALSNFYRDLSHEKPVHPDALAFLLKTIGFQEIQVLEKAPFARELLLQEVDAAGVSDDALQTQFQTLNSNIRQLNELLYGHLDYAIVARKVKLV